MDRMIVGVDIGGTTIKLAFITEKGELKTKWEIPTNIKENGKYIVNEIKEAIESKSTEIGIDRKSLLGIGVGAPGFIDMDKGIIIHAVNIGWKDYHLKTELENATGLPTVVDNDANLAGAGELWVGSAKGSKDVLFVTLGTGVGGGIVINGEIVHGVKGVAGEIGHLTADYTGRFRCNCGKKGCLETVASATGIVNLTKKHQAAYAESVLIGENITAKDIFDAYSKQDALAVYVVNEFANYLGISIANIANTLNPEVIVIGGGVSKAGDTLLKPLKEVFEYHAIPKAREVTELKIASLGNEAGVFGCAWLILNYLNKNKRSN